MKSKSPGSGKISLIYSKLQNCGPKEKLCVLLDRTEVLKYFQTCCKTKYKCQICIQELPSEEQLRQHLRIHVGEPPFKCELCDRGFNNENTFEVHMMHYTNEKPIKCIKCGKEFSNENRLKEHCDKVHLNTLNLSENGLVFSKIVKDNLKVNDNSGICKKIEELKFEDTVVKHEMFEENCGDSEQVLKIYKNEDNKDRRM